MLAAAKVVLVELLLQVVKMHMLRHKDDVLNKRYRSVKYEYN